MTTDHREPGVRPAAPAPRGLVPIPIRRALAALAVIAILPYTALKVLWLSGSEFGMVPGSGPGLMHDTRMEIGNVVTVVAAVTGAVVALALSQRWGQRLPWWTVVLPAAAATGALAPIALGLPVGAVLQAIVAGTVRSGGEGNLTDWVFALVYGGFAVFGIALAVLFADYVERRWSRVVDAAPRRPHSRWIRVVTAGGILPFSAAMLFWAVAPTSAGLAGWESLAQRVVLVVVAILSLLGCGVLLAAGERPRPRVRWMLGFVGCCTAAVQGPVMLLLANDARINPALLVVTLFATPSAMWLGLSSIHRTAGSLR
ncbi:hypothetical protein ACFFGH_22560 [Lysobacter korlensis]|uniref:Uncharacterized protein n=1 Tax=Lysobacter korlensis TaxID=553636 RepID=A0ABV6RW24_9GAMM